MKKRFKTFILLVSIICLFVTCHGNNYNNAVNPKGLSYNSYYGGNGTNYNQGTLIININNSNSYYSAYQYYVVSIRNLGTYNFPSGATQLTIPYVWPKNYPFTITIGCLNSYNSGCYQRYMNGSAYVNAGYTTVVNAWP